MAKSPMSAAQPVAVNSHKMYKYTFFLLFLFLTPWSMAQSNLYSELTTYIKLVESTMAPPTGERLEALNDLATYLAEKNKEGKTAQLIFICTHNSRRSHLSQIWAQTSAAYYGLGDIVCYSGGTEATAFNYRAVAALERIGFRIENPGGTNPRYSVFSSDRIEPLVCFSKTFSDASNPQREFCAIMTCSDADKNCPFVPGADFRIPIPYNDPKEADNTPAEPARYDERCRQIAGEMLYVMRKTKELIR
jgi:arsenate reductase